ncbi:MAG: radical SAM protein [Salinivirgaceae bacterium]|jgi:MoaA/NifB/PqqE/SkfB family radical SAM enzyme|nr:radical SAM protein [Salinivirgaceae bacterium]
MANLSLTDKCNKQCTYCFAGSGNNNTNNAFMTIDLFQTALNYLKRSGIKQVRLLGGEPTLHPNFVNFVDIALENNFEIMLFTNGLINAKTLKYLHELPLGKLKVLMNTIHPNEKNNSGQKQQEKTMKLLGKKLIVGVNIFNESQDLLYLLDYIQKYQLKNEIRLGIAHPILGKQNAYLHPKQYKTIGEKVLALKIKVMKYNTSLTFDCGFVPCMFAPEYHNILRNELKNTGKCCEPILDLMPNGKFISCYPLSNFHSMNIKEQSTSNEIKQVFNKQLEPYKLSGIFPYCKTCSLFNNACNGGCISYRIQRFKIEYQ